MDDAVYLHKLFPAISDEEFDEQRAAFGIWAANRQIDTPPRQRGLGG